MKILVLHGSSGNLGDTAMLEGTVLTLLRNLPTAELFIIDQPGLRTTIWKLPRVHKQSFPKFSFPYEYALAAVPYFWRYQQQWRHALRGSLALGIGRIFSPNSTRVPRFQAVEGPRTIKELCDPFDGLYMVGGGYLTDTFPEFLVQACCIAQAFGQERKPILLSGQQVGPFRSRILRALTGRLLRHARFVGLREPTRSVELCRAFRLKPQSYQVTGDDSFGLPFASDAEVSAFLASHRLEPGKFIALNVRLGFYADEHKPHIRMIAQIGESLAHAFGFPIVAVPIAFNEVDSDDRSGEELLRLMTKAKRQRIDSRYLTPSLVGGFLGKAFGAVGISYHFCTFALSQGVPSVALYDGEYYSQKASGICKFWQDDRLAISLQKVSAPGAVDHIAAFFRDSSQRRQLSERARSAIQNWHTVVDQKIQENFGHCHSNGDPIKSERPESTAVRRAHGVTSPIAETDYHFSENRKE